MDITIPYNYSPRKYQLRYHRAKQRFKIAVLNRRAGKSKMALNEQIRKAVTSKGVYYYFLPTYRQAKSVIWDSLIHEHLPREVVSKLNESELAVYYKNGSVQRFVGCEDVDKHRGINPIDVVFDEYSEMDEEIWTAIVQPVLAENHGTATFIYTPKGKNHSWKLLNLAKNDPDRWFYLVMGVDKTLSHTEEELENVKRETPEALFLQEYMCEFHDNAGAFFKRIKENTINSFDVPEPSDMYQIGVDLAKYQDWTVLTPLNLNTFHVGKQERFNQVDWNLQKARIEAFARRYNNAKIVIDSTGVGDPIVEDLQRVDNLLVEPFKFTEVSKRQLLDNLAILLEQDKIKIPDDDGLKAELESMRMVLSKSGKIKIETMSNMTDDRVMSLALSVWDAKEPLVGTHQAEDYVLYVQDFN